MTVFDRNYDKYVLTRLVIVLRQTGHFGSDAAQFVHVTKWPHGINTTPNSLSAHILQSLSSFSLKFSRLNFSSSSCVNGSDGLLGLYCSGDVDCDSLLCVEEPEPVDVVRDMGRWGDMGRSFEVPLNSS